MITHKFIFVVSDIIISFTQIYDNNSQADKKAAKPAMKTVIQARILPERLESMSSSWKLS